MNSSNDQSQPSNEKEGFKFAVTLLAIFGSIFYYIYIYFKNEVVSFYIYFTISLLICIITIMIIALILYFLIKGYSFEVQGSTQKKILNEIASKIYLFIFLVFIFLFPPSFGCLIFFTFADIQEQSFLFLYYLMICAGFSLLFIDAAAVKLFFDIKERYKILNIFGFKNKLNKKENRLEIINDFSKMIFSLKDYLSKYIFKYFLIFILTVCGLYYIFFILIPSMSFIPIFVFNGHINVDVENIHQKNDIMIPVKIQVTGMDDPITVGLFKVVPNNSIPIAKIEHLGTQLIDNQNGNFREIFANVSDFKNDNCLLGNALGSGKYILFINTTNLSIGYYKLEVNNSHINSGDGFFLLDNTSILLN